jgi:hypothetical protein
MREREREREKEKNKNGYGIWIDLEMLLAGGAMVELVGSRLVVKGINLAITNCKSRE